MSKIISKKKHILIVDDDPDILEALNFHLSSEGYQISCFNNGEDAITCAKTKRSDMIILDIMLPGMDGFEVLSHLKRNANTKDIPVIILSVKSEDTDIVISIELGAFDYITKPFSMKVLSARIRSIFRDSLSESNELQEVIKAGEITIYPEKFRVTVQNTPVNLTSSEYGILRFLAKKPGIVFSREQIAEAIHDNDFPVTARSVDVQIYGLRKKLGPLRHCLETVWKVGYRLKR